MKKVDTSREHVLRGIAVDLRGNKKCGRSMLPVFHNVSSLLFWPNVYERSGE